MGQHLVRRTTSFEDSFEVRRHVPQMGYRILGRESVLDPLPGFLDFSRVGFGRDIERSVVVDLGDVVG